MRLLLLTLLFAGAAAAQPLRLPQPPLRSINTEQFHLPPSPPELGLFTLWPNSHIKFTGSLGFNTLTWGNAQLGRTVIGYDVRAKFYINPRWTLLLRHQTMYITSDETLFTGVIYHIPLHCKRSRGVKL